MKFDMEDVTDMTTTLAAVRLIPIPPAFVESRKTGMLSSSVNSSSVASAA